MSEISIANPKETFLKHINNPNNKRIIFSGPFGTGKSYFLTSTLKNNLKTNTFFINPINYSVSQNEDIFEYVKIDIALQILQYPELRSKIKDDFGSDLFINEYLKSQPLESIQLLLKCVKESGIPIVSQLSSIGVTLLEGNEKYLKWKQSLEEVIQTDDQILSNYIEKNSKIKGSIFEDDLITQTIRAALTILKDNTKKDNVLIFDDFDRLDPEHIFRILNVLSVHNNHINGDNKFGIDQIIIVCDIENIEKIYRHKFGPEVDFEGYIDKFYSIDIFRFTNEAAISSYCEKEIKILLNDESSLKTLGILLSQFVKYKHLTIRNLIKHQLIQQLYNFEFIEKDFSYNMDFGTKRIARSGYSSNFETYFDEKTAQFRIFSKNLKFLQAIKILSEIFGGYSRLKNAVTAILKIESLKSDTFGNEIKNHIIFSLAPLILIANNKKSIQKVGFSYEETNKFAGFVEIDYTNPKVEMFNHFVIIKLGWKDNNKYKNECCLFENINKDSFILQKYSQYKESNSIYDLFVFFNKIINYIEEEGLLSKIGISV